MNLAPLIRTWFRSSRAQPVRTGLMIFGIALGVAGVVAIDIARTSVSKSFELSTAALTARSTHQIQGHDLSIPQSLFTRLRTGPGIRKTAPVISKRVKVVELGGRTLTLLGIDPFSETHFRDFRFKGTGRDPREPVREVMIRGSGVIMTRELARAHSLSRGDGLTLILGERQVPTRIGALVDPGPEGRMLEGVLLADIGLAQEILEMGDRITRIDLNLDSRDEINRVKDLLGAGQFLVDTAQQNQAVRSLSLSFETSLTAFSVLVLFMSIFLIYNTVSFSVARRRRVNGTFRALGATRHEIFWATQIEVMTYALAGSALGLVLGIILGKGAVQTVCATVSEMYYTLTVNQTRISVVTLVKGMATGLGASLASSLVPAINAAATKPVTLMQHSSQENRLNRYLPWLTMAGLIVLSPALGIFTREGAGTGLVFTGIFMVFTAAALLAPAMVAGLTRATARLLDQMETFGPGKGGDGRLWIMARMGVRNLGRSLSRTSVLIASLMVVISVYIGIDTMTQSFRASISQWVDGHIGGDIHISALDELNPALDRELLKQIQTMEGVALVSSYNIHKTYSSRSGEVHIFSYIRDGSKKKWTWLDPAAGPGNDQEINPLLDDGWILVSEILARRHGLSTKTLTVARVVMETVEGPVSFRVAGIFRDFFMGGGRAVVGRNTMKRFWAKDEITAMQVFLSETADTDKAAAIAGMIPRIRAAAPAPERLRIRSGPGIKKRILAVFDNTFLITTALQVLTALVALTGIVNSVTALILERARELGVLRAWGAEPAHIRTMVLWECGLSGFMAGLLALPLGLFLSWVLIDVVNFKAFGWTYEIEISGATLVLALVFSSLAALGAGLVPGIQAGRVKVAQALRTE